MALISACHRYGWPVAKGGSQAIADALAAALRESGGTIETGRPVRAIDELPAADAVVFDLAPAAVAEIAGGRISARAARGLRRYRHGPGAFKVDLAVEGGVPWIAEGARRAGTVHAAGSFEEIVAAERDVNRGRMPERPFVLVGQQYLADPGRSEGDVHPVWSYCHVPNGYPGDATEAVIDQIERFAPGLRERIVARHVRSPAGLEAYNANYVGGDIITGATNGLQAVIRPRLDARPLLGGWPRPLHLLGGDAARRRGARDGRLQRRPAQCSAISGTDDREPRVLRLRLEAAGVGRDKSRAVAAGRQSRAAELAGELHPVATLLPFRFNGFERSRA